MEFNNSNSIELNASYKKSQKIFLLYLSANLQIRKHSIFFQF